MRTFATMLAAVLLIAVTALLVAQPAAGLGFPCKVVAGKLVCGPIGIPIPTITPKAS